MWLLLLSLTLVCRVAVMAAGAVGAPALSSNPYAIADPRIIREIGVTPFSVPLEIGSMRWSPNGKLLFATSEAQVGVLQLDPATGAVTRSARLERDRWDVCDDALVGTEWRMENGVTKQRFGCWNLTDLSPRWNYPDSTTSYRAVIAPDQKKVAVFVSTGRAPASLELVDMATGKKLWSVSHRGMAAGSGALWVTPRILAVMDRSLRFVDGETGAEIGALGKIFEKIGSPFRLVDANPSDGTLLVLWEGGFQVWKVLSDHEAQRLMGMAAREGEALPHGGFIRKDTPSVLVIFAGESRLYPLNDTGDFVRIPIGGAKAVGNRASNLLAVACCSFISTYSGSTGAPLNRFPAHSHQIRKLAFTPDGTLIAGSSHRHVWFWDVRSGRYMGRLEHVGANSAGGDFCFSPDGRAMLSSDGLELWKWDYRSALGVGNSGQVGGALGARRRLATWSRGDASGKVHLSVSANGEKLAVAAQYFAYLFDPRSNEELLTSRLVPFSVQRRGFPQVGPILLSPDGTRALVKRFDAVEIYDVPGQTLEGDISASQFLGASADGASFATVESVISREVLIRSQETGDIRLRLPLVKAAAGTQRSVTGGVFSPRGDLFVAAAVGNPDGWTGFYVWDLATAKLRAVVPTSRGTVQQVIFSPAGDSLATLNADASTTLWDMSKILEGGVPE